MKNVNRLVYLYVRMLRQSRRRKSRQGQTLVEYALILAFISVVAISVLINLGQEAKAIYTVIDSQVARAPGGVNYVPGG